MDIILGSGGAAHAEKAALCDLWQQGWLCDVRLVPSAGQAIAAHKIIVAANSLFLRAMFVGAGRSMLERSQMSVDQCSEGDRSACGVSQVIQLPEVQPEALHKVVTAWYEGRITVSDDPLSLSTVVPGALLTTHPTPPSVQKNPSHTSPPS